MALLAAGWSIFGTGSLQRAFAVVLSPRPALPMLFPQRTVPATLPQAAAPDGSDTLAPLPLPVVPAALRTPRERAAYLLGHFWDAMDFGDTLRSRNERFMEQSLVDFLSLFPHAAPGAPARAVKELVRRAETDREACMLLLELAEKYLYTPGSPMRCEEHFIPFLEAWVRTPVLDEAEKLRPALLLEEARRNRPGSRAANLEFRTRDGAHGTLYGIRGERLLLLFYNPDCPHCTEAIRLLDGDAAFRRAVQSGRLVVAALCADEDPQAWERTKELLPAGWVVGFAAEAFGEDAPYLLPEMPALYLLDRRKRVLFKEIAPQQLLRLLDEEAGEE